LGKGFRYDYPVCPTTLWIISNSVTIFEFLEKEGRRRRGKRFCMMYFGCEKVVLECDCQESQ